MQRLTLLAFAALFILLFVAFAVARGIGNPSVPSDAVAVIEDAPDDLGTITDAEFQHALDQTAAAAQEKSAPKPGDAKYEELKETALGEVLDRIWLQGQGEEMGISITPKEVADELKKLKKQAFKTEKQYEEFLKEAHYTQADVDERVKIQILSKDLQTQINADAPIPSSREIEEFYEAAKSSRYTQAETRDVRAIVNKDKAKAEEAKAELEKDDSAEAWKRLAKQSDNTTNKSSGGLIPGLTEGKEPEPLNAALFEAPQGQVEGPLPTPSGYTVYEVEKITPEKVQSLEEVKSQISNQLAEEAKQANISRFLRNYGSRWKSRTFCASDFTIERCSNFQGTGRPAEANPACYESDPKGGLPEDCPAPVTQIKPAQPGSVSLLAPEGLQLAQRPTPSVIKPVAAEGASPFGAPPTGAPEAAGE